MVLILITCKNYQNNHKKLKTSINQIQSIHDISYIAFKLIGEKKYVKYARHIIDVTLKAIYKGRKKIRYREYKGKGMFFIPICITIDAFYFKSQIENKVVQEAIQEKSKKASEYGCYLE